MPNKTVKKIDIEYTNGTKKSLKQGGIISIEGDDAFIEFLDIKDDDIEHLLRSLIFSLKMANKVNKKG